MNVPASALRLPIQPSQSSTSTIVARLDCPFEQDHEPKYIQTRSEVGTKIFEGNHVTVYRDNFHNTLLAKDDLKVYLAHELTTPRLTPILDHLWLAGRPMAARPLHRQVMMKRSIVVTEQTDLHLIWVDGTIFVKPLPTFLLQRQFWLDHLSNDEGLHSSALGMILSYVWLINHPSDLKIAHETGLLSTELKWSDWITLSRQLTTFLPLHSLEGVAPRFQFGELRLSRINWIYRLNPRFRLRYFVRGYYYTYQQYGTYFQRNFGWLLTLGVFVSIVLSGLQVGLATEDLVKQSGFRETAYWSTVLSLGLAAAAVASVALLFVFFFLNNLVVAVIFLYKQRKNRLRAAAKA